MKRRKLLKLSLAGAVGGALSSPLRAEELPQAAATGVDVEGVRRFVDRSINKVIPIDDVVIRSQQAEADRFARLGLIPRPVKVADIVWEWTPAS
jgi:hypothetical protein